MKIQPLGDRVLIKRDTQKKEEKLASGIYIASNEKDSSPKKQGEIVAVGEGVKKEDGSYEPLPVKEGDTVLFSWGDTVTVDEQEYEIVHIENILAVINN